MIRRYPRVAHWATAFVAALVSAALLWVGLLSGGPAYAHAGIVEASPEYDETVARPPEEVRLKFNEAVQAEFDPVKVYGPGGERVDGDDARTDPDEPTVIVASLDEDLPAGAYRVEWRDTSADGHPIDGEYRFVAREGAANADDPNANGADEDNARSDEGAGAGGGRSEPSSGGGLGRIAAYGVLGAGVAAVAVIAFLRRKA